MLMDLMLVYDKFYKPLPGKLRTIILTLCMLSVVPRGRHCRIPTTLPPMSLKNAPSAGLRAHLENLLIFSLFIAISIFSVT